MTEATQGNRKQFFRWRGRRIGSSKATPLFAAAAVVLATGSGFIAGEFSSGGVACEIQRERALAEGPPMLRLAKAAIRETYNAEVALELARVSGDFDQKREFAYEAIRLVNNGIMTAFPLEEDPPKLWRFPTDEQLKNPGYYLHVSSQIEELDHHHMTRSLSKVDEDSAEQMMTFYQCDRANALSTMLNLIAVVFTALSVILIAVRERFQNG